MTPERLDELECFALMKLRDCVTEHVTKYVTDLANAGYGEAEIKAVCDRQMPELRAWADEQAKRIRPWLTAAAYGFAVNDLA